MSSRIGHRAVGVAGGVLVAALTLLAGESRAQPCSVDADCVDADPCTIDRCDPSDWTCRNPLAPGTLFAIDDSGTLCEVDRSTGTMSPTGPTGVVACALTFDPTTAVLYSGSCGGTDNLFTVDPVTGSSHLLGPTGLNAWAIEGLAFDGGGALFASLNTVGAVAVAGDTLAILDARTGAATSVGPFGSSEIAGIAFDSHGSLFGCSGSGSSTPTLYTIDTSTGAATAIGPILDAQSTPPVGGVEGLGFDIDGLLLGSTGAGRLIRIDPATAMFDDIGGTGAVTLRGLAIRRACRAVCVPPLALYGTNGGYQELHHINTVTGETTLIGVSTIMMPSLAVHPTTGVMYAGTGASVGDLNIIDPITAQASFIGNHGLGPFTIVGLDFATDGRLYASLNTIGPFQQGGDSLAELDPLTGAGTIIGSFGIPDIPGITFDHHGTLYAVSGGTSGPPALYTIDLTTGAATFVAAVVDLQDTPHTNPIGGLEFDLAGFFYGETAQGPLGTPGPGGDLLRIDPVSGRFTIAGTGTPLGSLAFQEFCRPRCAAGSALFAIEAASGRLSRINPVTGSVQVVGTAGIDAASLAADPVTGRIFAGTAGGQDMLYRIDPTTAVATPVGVTGLGAWELVGLDFASDRTLYAALNTTGVTSSGADSLAVLDPTTGTGTLIGSFGSGITDVGGIALHPSGALYGASGLGGGTPILYAIDRITGAASVVGPIEDVLGNPPAFGVSALETDLGGILTGTLGNGQLIRIDPASGSFSPVASPGGVGLDGIAFLDACPSDCASDSHCEDGDPCTIDHCDVGTAKCTMTLPPDSESARGADDVCGTADDNPTLYGIDAVCGTTDDGAGDGVCDIVDLCVSRFDPSNVDGDGDLFGDACDCSPADGSFWAVPGEALALRLTHAGGAGGTTTLSWSAPINPGGAILLYDMLRSDWSDLFTDPHATCLESDDGADRQALDGNDPTPIAYYLVRAENPCGAGTAGTRRDGATRSARACP